MALELVPVENGGMMRIGLFPLFPGAFQRNLLIGVQEFTTRVKRFVLHGVEEFRRMWCIT